MIKKFLLYMLFGFPVAVAAQTNIIIFSPYDAGGAMNAAMQRLIQQANGNQKQYLFTYQIRPGAQGMLSMEAMNSDPHNRLTLVNAAFADNLSTGRVTMTDYQALHALGDACWVVASTNGREGAGIASLAQSREIVVGTVGVGSATHLTALAIGKRLNLPVRLVLYKSNHEALVQMAGNHGINFVIERPEAVRNMQKINPAIQILAANCPQRLLSEPHIKTLTEQGVASATIFVAIIANRAMDAGRRQDIQLILDQAARNVGADAFSQASGLRSPLNDDITPQRFLESRVHRMQALQRQFASELEQAR